MIEFKVLFGFCFKTDGLTDEQMNGRMDKRTNGRMNGQRDICNYRVAFTTERYPNKWDIW